MCKLTVYSTQELLTVSGNSLPADVQGNRGLLTPPPGRWYPLLGQFEHISGFMENVMFAHNGKRYVCT